MLFGRFVLVPYVGWLLCRMVALCVALWVSRSWLLGVGCYRKVAVLVGCDGLVALSVGRCGLVTVGWSLWVSRCGLVLLCWSLYVSCYKLVTVGRLLWLVTVSY